MDEFEEQRHVVLRNLAQHAGLARGRMCLSVFNAARLAGGTPEEIGAVEGGRDCGLSLVALIQLALTLGLTELGLPRTWSPGME